MFKIMCDIDICFSKGHATRQDAEDKLQEVRYQIEDEIDTLKMEIRDKQDFSRSLEIRKE